MTQLFAVFSSRGKFNIKTQFRLRFSSFAFENYESEAIFKAFLSIIQKTLLKPQNYVQILSFCPLFSPWISKFNGISEHNLLKYQNMTLETKITAYLTRWLQSSHNHKDRIGIHLGICFPCQISSDFGFQGCILIL